jgi:hypothetical protein
MKKEGQVLHLLSPARSMCIACVCAELAVSLSSHPLIDWPKSSESESSRSCSLE